MAIKYNGNKAVLSGMREDVVAPNDFWQDFTKFLTQADYYNTAFKGNYDSYFGGITADWDAQDYQNFFNANGITDAVQGNSNVDISKITDLNKLKAIMGSMVIDQKGHFSNNKYKLPGTEIDKLKKGIKAYNAHNQLVTNLREKGGTDEQIQAILDSRDGSVEGYTSLYDDIADLSGDDWNDYIDKSLVNILPDNTWGDPVVITPANAEEYNYTYNEEDETYTDENGNTYVANSDNELVSTEDETPATAGSYTPSNAVIATTNADDAAQTATTATQSAILGDSTLDALRDYVSQNEGYTLEEDAENNTYTVTDADGNTVDTFAVDEKNNQIVYVGGEKDGQRFSTDGLPERIDTYQDVEDTTFADQQALASEVTGLRGEYEDYTTSVLGGDVTEGVAQQLGWTKTATGWTDPQGNDYTVNEDTGILESGGVAATTKGTFEDADFAGQINAQLNQFLTGKDADGNDILDEEGNPIKGFLDYQGDLEGAADTYKTDMQGLSSLYDQTYGDYANELDPLRRDMGDVRDRLGQVAQGQMDVARDASDRSYYNNLRDTLYADSADQLNRQTEAGMDSIRQSFAASGADPTSPAFVAAMKDLQQSRSDAMVGARRKAILDSYGLGGQMLGNRTNALAGAGNALGSEMSGIGSEMGALDSLYGVKLEGLNTRRDMIGQIYGAEKDKANIGVSGLNTVLDTGLKGVAADQNQFNTKLNLNNDFYGNLFKNIGLEYDVKGGLRDYADKETTSAFDTLVDYDQSFKSDDFTMGSFQLALQQAYPDGDIPEPLQNLIDKYSSK